MASISTSIAWRASLRARSVPASRWSQRPSALLRTERGFSGARYASESTSSAAAEMAKEAPKELKEVSRKAGRKSKKGLYGTSLALVLLVGYIYGTDTRASIHRYGVVPLLRLIYPDAEEAHHAGVENLKMLYKYGLHPRERGNPDSDGALATEVCLYATRYEAQC